MLTHLEIENYALIDRLSLDFGQGLSIVTGETGAGKSIMLGALSLLGGARADARAGVKARTLVEATFTGISDEAHAVLEEIDAEAGDDCVILRREITPSGRSRAFVNDTPVNLATLAGMARKLIDIHTQHANAALADGRSQLAMLDAWCDNDSLLAEYRHRLADYMRLRHKIKTIKEEALRNKENREYIRFQLEQLEKLNPKPGELKEVEREFDVLSDADALGERLGRARNALTTGDGSALDNVSEAMSALQYLDPKLLPALEEASVEKRLREVMIEIKDISETVEDCLDGVEPNPVRLAKVAERMNQLYEANKRFRIKEEDGLVKLREQLRSQLQAIDGNDGATLELESEARRLASILKTDAAVISGRRAEGARRFESLLIEQARTLGLKNLTFEIRLTPCKLNRDGADNVEFICSFNKNGKMEPLAKVASGGEMSRMMLCIKRIMAGKTQLPTVVFDEVDTGVSGDVADKMGAMMQSMARDIQVVSITHLPQVAARGNDHYLVYKADVGARTVSNVRRLDASGREREIARMLAGAVVDEAAMANARSLLAAANA